jgi:hypothetical protein
MKQFTKCFQLVGLLGIPHIFSFCIFQTPTPDRVSKYAILAISRKDNAAFISWGVPGRYQA